MKSIDPKLLQKVERLYGLTDLKFVEKIKSGYLSHNFVLQSGKEKYFLKQYKYDEKRRVEQIHQVQNFFWNNGIPIIHPIITKNSREIFLFKKKHFTLLPFVSGRIIKKKSRSKKAYQSAGKMLAKIHKLSKNGFPQIIDTRAHWTKEEFEEQSQNIYSAIKSIKNKTAFDKKAFKVIQLKLKLAKKEPISYKDFKPTHIIHGDYYGQNIFFNDKDEVSHVFDLEKAEPAPRSYELARSLDFMCFSTEFNKQSFTNGRSYLQAYNSVYPISKKELVFGIKINYLIMIYSLWILKEHYILKSTRADDLLDSQYKSLLYYSRNFDEFVKKLLSKDTKGDI